MTGTTLDLVAMVAEIPSHPDAPCWTSDRHLWTSDSKRDRDEAAGLCVSLGCPILAECRAAAAARKERFGVWGGVNVETLYRDHYRGRPRKVRARPACGSRNGYTFHRRHGEATCGPCRAANYRYMQAGRASRARARAASDAASRDRMSRRLH